MPLLELKSVSKRYGGVIAVREVSFAVESGEICGVMGANGAGKTTLFALIAGHSRPDRGTTSSFRASRWSGCVPIGSVGSASDARFKSSSRSPA